MQRQMQRTNLLLLLMMAFALPCLALPGLKANGDLDKEFLSTAYFEGEFEIVREALETYRKKNPEPSREDAIFMYKYLSVIHAANDASRAKAESYMYQLLKLSPTIELLDMYISDNIQAIFSRVKADYQKRVEYGQNHNRLGDPLVDTEPKQAEVSGKKSNAWLWWTLGGVAAAGAVTSYVVLGQPDDEPVSAKPTHTFELVTE